MNDPLNPSPEPTLPGFDAPISSLGSEAGTSPSNSPDGATTKSGPAHAPASLTARRVSRKATPTPETSGPTSSASSPSAALNTSLANKSARPLNMAGSTKFSRTSKASGTSAAPRSSRRPPSGPITSDRAYSGARSSREKDREYSEKRRRLHPANEMIRHARARAKKYGIPFDLDEHREELERRMKPMLCEMTGLPFVRARLMSRSRSFWIPSLDRIKPGKGYTIKNIRIVAWGMNCALQNWGEKELARAMQAWLSRRD